MLILLWLFGFAAGVCFTLGLIEFGVINWRKND
jgi:hypothetical protein